MLCAVCPIVFVLLFVLDCGSLLVVSCLLIVVWCVCLMLRLLVCVAVRGSLSVVCCLLSGCNKLLLDVCCLACLIGYAFVCCVLVLLVHCPLAVC